MRHIVAWPVVDLQLGLTAMSQRESQVSTLVASGKSNKEIAYALHMAQATVRNHIAHVMDGAKVRNRVELTLWLLLHPDARHGHAVRTGVDLPASFPDIRMAGEDRRPRHRGSELYQAVRIRQVIAKTRRGYSWPPRPHTAAVA